MHEIKSKRIRPYAEPVEVSDLNAGMIYFKVTYVDAACCIPMVESLVFLGAKKLGGTQKLLFQDVETYWCDADSNESAKFECSTNGINSIFEFDKALEELERCSIRRRQMQVK